MRVPPVYVLDAHCVLGPMRQAAGNQKERALVSCRQGKQAEGRLFSVFSCDKCPKGELSRQGEHLHRVQLGISSTAGSSWVWILAEHKKPSAGFQTFRDPECRVGGAVQPPSPPWL